MGLFDLFKKKKAQLTEEQLKWNKMWELWTEEETESPFTELMTYQSEVNNGGHHQYFSNVENTGDLQKEMSALETVLSPILKNNLQQAYKAYLLIEETEDEKAQEIIEQCDDIFFENEEEINRKLEDYAAKIEL